MRCAGRISHFNGSFLFLDGQQISATCVLRCRGCDASTALDSSNAASSALWVATCEMHVESSPTPSFSPFSPSFLLALILDTFPHSLYYNTRFIFLLIFLWNLLRRSVTGFFRYGSIADDGFNNTTGVWVFAPSMIKELSSLKTGRGYSPRISDGGRGCV